MSSLMNDFGTNGGSSSSPELELFKELITYLTWRQVTSRINYNAIGNTLAYVPLSSSPISINTV